MIGKTGEHHPEIRPLEGKDYKSLFEIIESNRERLLPDFPVTVPYIKDLKSAKKFIKLRKLQETNKETYFFSIVLKGKLTGLVFIKQVDWRVPKCEIAYFIDKKYEDRGMISKAVKWLLKYCFEELNMIKVYTRINPENQSSIGVCLNNGFIKEGILRNEFRDGNGILRDVECYAAFNHGK